MSLILSVSIFSSTVSFATLTKDLKKGNENSEVLELQNFLFSKKYLIAKPNGYFGPATQAAVQAFQKANKISQTGTIGPVTRAKINSLNKNVSVNTNSSNLNTSSNTNSTSNISNINASSSTNVVLDTKVNSASLISNFSTSEKNILAKNFSVAAWIPYWREASGTEQIIQNINKVDIVSPFSYEMNDTGTFSDPMKLGSGPYSEMIKSAHQNGKLVIPSILWWASGYVRDNVDIIMADDYMRGYLIDKIEIEIAKYNLDGIDIDFENKKAESRDNFSKFLEELSTRLHKNGKVLVCTIESRTPSQTEFVTGPNPEDELSRSNDFKRIGKACDQVRIMAYDQDTADKDLNSVKGITSETGYRPVADIDWVKKVLTLAMRDIEWKKIILGVPTYGYKYEITRDSVGNIKSYSRIGSMNWYYADEEARNRNITPVRDSTGEVHYTYFDSSKGKEYMIWYSDAESIKQKADLAKLYKIGGIAIFKIDGNNDKTVWSKL